MFNAFSNYFVSNILRSPGKFFCTMCQDVYVNIHVNQQKSSFLLKLFKTKHDLRLNLYHIHSKLGFNYTWIPVCSTHQKISFQNRSSRPAVTRVLENKCPVGGLLVMSKNILIMSYNNRAHITLYNVLVCVTTNIKHTAGA